MSDAFDDRRRGLEEEYFHRKNQELIETMRAQMKVSEEAKAAAAAAMQCPRVRRHVDGNEGGRRLDR
jgi:hypothetical protein